MRQQDMAFPTYREHGVLYCRGIDPIMPLSLFPRRRPGRLGSIELSSTCTRS